MEIKTRQKSPKVAKIFHCETCEYTCSKLSDYTKHCSTRKHKMEILEKSKENDGKTLHNRGYNCLKCGKNYETNAGLWKHSKKCQVGKSDNTLISEDDILSSEPIKNYIMKLVEQNNELKNMFIQQNTEFIQHNAELKEIKTIIAEQPPPQQITNIHNKTTNNTQFNLNVFLQQTCKDALNMSDFIETLKIDAASLHHTGTHGYVNGISKIFTDGLRKLKVHERPIHCSDLKREVLYIKDNDKWEKDEENKQFKKALSTVVYRNMGQLEKWEEENPRCRIQETDDYEFYFEVVRQSLGGGDQDVTDRNNEKILKAIAKEVHIDRKVKELL
jgi:hypothetical protein